jgi:hypothetical protein
MSKVIIECKLKRDLEVSGSDLIIEFFNEMHNFFVTKIYLLHLLNGKDLSSMNTYFI